MSTAVIPEPIAQLQHQLDQFRSTQPRRGKLPESLWQAAVELIAPQAATLRECVIEFESLRGG